ncbi:squalene/phytoene synthase family protein [Phenylobacterium deserti]|uniref:Phytoene/squalene synthase family protein n=1 Tax=Phenylobacterium deserti TaxID=1914756 RepID=A0A328ACI4_9CAUL|nr:squalene/phytoene synthase family protein [Phenylobacterium deserti]RAK52349.1 phytoene/squalene synthase family protein [Phenylobacterium deserti]
MSEDPTDLDALVRRVDPDRWASSRFIADADKRADVLALYAFDHEVARAPRVASNPILGEIRLTWWGEVLDEVFEGREVRRHPTAQALALAVRRRELPRAALQAMIDTRYRELDPAAMDETEALDWARETGGVAAELAARILDPDAHTGPAGTPGAAWALARRVPDQPHLRPVFDRLLTEARRSVRSLGVAAFPAVAHATFAAERAAGHTPSGLRSRLRLTLAVARGRL